MNNEIISWAEFQIASSQMMLQSACVSVVAASSWPKLPRKARRRFFSAVHYSRTSHLQKAEPGTHHSSYKNQRRGRAAQWADVAAIILLCNFVCACSKMASWTNPTIQSKIAWRDDDVVVSVPMKSGTTWYVSHRFVALAHFFIIAS